MAIEIVKKLPVNETWMYRINDDTTIKYLFLVTDYSEKTVMGALKPFLDKKKSYAYHIDEKMVAEYPKKVFRFGMVFAIKGIEEPGFCYRCGNRGVFVVTALVCPRCKSSIGGF